MPAIRHFLHIQEGMNYNQYLTFIRRLDMSKVIATKKAPAAAPKKETKAAPKKEAKAAPKKAAKK